MANEQTRGQLILNGWKMHRKALIELVALLPEAGGTFRPWDGGMTTLELIHHLAWTPDFFFSAIEKRDMNIPSVPLTLAEARELLLQLTEATERKLAAYTETDLQHIATVELLKVTEPVENILNRLIGHEAHHKGQLFVYARMLGVTPPFYVDLTV